MQEELEQNNDSIYYPLVKLVELYKKDREKLRFSEHRNKGKLEWLFYTNRKYITRNSDFNDVWYRIYIMWAH